MSLSSLALVAGCGGGGEGAGIFSYLPNFAAPAPIDIAVLTAGFALGPSVAADAVALLATSRYNDTRTGIVWLQQQFDPTIPDNATQYPLLSSGAAFAHAAGVTGKGQLIAISDEHMSPGHSVFAGKTVTMDSDVIGGDEHGTSVASVAAGNSAGFVGTAPDADLLFGTWDDDNLAALGQRALTMGAVAWNNSWGYFDAGLTQSAFNASFSTPSGQGYLAALDAYAAQGVVVFSLSNDALNGATLMDGLPYLRHGLEAGWLAVANGVPTIAGNTITDVHLLSNACWQAARWCLVADGSWNAATGPATAFEYTTGSSFASPQVAGALALLAEAFPTLSPHELRIRLLASAEDDFFTPDATVELAEGFDKGYSITYGHGFLDIEAALRPIGPIAMALASGDKVATSAPVLKTGAAFGDAVELSLIGTDVAVKDALSAGFAMPAKALTTGAQPASLAASLLAAGLGRDFAADRKAAPSALAVPFPSLAGPVLSLATTDGLSGAVLVPMDPSGPMGLSLARALTDGPTRVDLGLKLARDPGGLMSLDGDGAVGMASIILGVTQDLDGGAFLALSGEIGMTDLGGQTALGDAGSARFDALRLTAGQSGIFTRGDRLSVGLAMPVAIASGETRLTLPVMREGLSAFESVALDLAPDNRQVDLEVTYQTALAERLEMRLSLVHSDDVGNRAGISDTGGAMAFTFRF